MAMPVRVSVTKEHPSLNFFGMGSLEVIVIFVVAFLAFGPSKTIEMARTAGKVLRDLRRTFNEVAASVSLEDNDNRPSRNNPPRPPETSDGPPPAQPL